MSTTTFAERYLRVVRHAEDGRVEKRQAAADDLAKALTLSDAANAVAYARGQSSRDYAARVLSFVTKNDPDAALSPESPELFVINEECIRTAIRTRPKAVGDALALGLVSATCCGLAPAERNVGDLTSLAGSELALRQRGVRSDQTKRVSRAKSQSFDAAVSAANLQEGVTPTFGTLKPLFENLSLSSKGLDAAITAMEGRLAVVEERTDVTFLITARFSECVSATYASLGLLAPLFAAVDLEGATRYMPGFSSAKYYLAEMIGRDKQHILISDFITTFDGQSTRPGAPCSPSTTVTPILALLDGKAEGVSVSGDDRMDAIDLATQIYLERLFLRAIVSG